LSCSRKTEVEAISLRLTLLEEVGEIFVVVAVVMVDMAAVATMVAGATEPPSKRIKDKEGPATN
jgi:hypothetical protein